MGRLWACWSLQIKRCDLVTYQRSQVPSLQLVWWLWHYLCIRAWNRTNWRCSFCWNVIRSNIVLPSFRLYRLKTNTHLRSFSLFSWMLAHVFLHYLLECCCWLSFHRDRYVRLTSCVIFVLSWTCRWSTLKDCCNNRDDFKCILLWICCSLLHFRSKRCWVPNNNCFGNHFSFIK